MIYDLMIYNLMIYDLMIYDLMIYDLMIYNLMIYDLMIYDLMIYDLMIYDLMIYLKTRRQGCWGSVFKHLSTHEIAVEHVETPRGVPKKTAINPSSNARLLGKRFQTPIHA